MRLLDALAYRLVSLRDCLGPDCIVATADWPFGEAGLASAVVLYRCFALLYNRPAQSCAS